MSRGMSTCCGASAVPGTLAPVPGCVAAAVVRFRVRRRIAAPWGTSVRSRVTGGPSRVLSSPSATVRSGVPGRTNAADIVRVPARDVGSTAVPSDLVTPSVTLGTLLPLSSAVPARLVQAGTRSPQMWMFDREAAGGTPGRFTNCNVHTPAHVVAGPGRLRSTVTELSDLQL